MEYATAQATASSYDGTSMRTATISAPSLTAEMMSNASIEVLVKLSTEAFQLPYRSFAGGKWSTIIYTLSAGKITIRRMTDGCNEESCLIPLSSVLQYRYVLIPGAVPAS